MEEAVVVRHGGGAACKLVEVRVRENQICTMPPHPLRLLFHPFESFLAQRNEEWIHEAWRKRRCQPGHDARVCPSPLKPLELRDIDTGNKIVERFRTDEALETTNISSLLIRKDSRTKL
uniref:Uncharacterized protein n=1 Tax=Aegilops tauschii subsp. strangulata TaxID=200361 RepID=A0A453CEH5_AEGTS